VLSLTVLWINSEGIRDKNRRWLAASEPLPPTLEIFSQPTLIFGLINYGVRKRHSLKKEQSCWSKTFRTEY
jgi:hypothetical protein